MEVLLLSDITGIGRKNDLIVVSSGYALNHLLPARKALVVTPSVRKQYAEQIKTRALEREKERELQLSLAQAVSGKTVRLSAKTGKAGKLYAAISHETIADALKSQFGIELSPSAVTIKEPIKSVGPHTVTITIGAQSSELAVEIKAEEPAKVAT